MNPVSEIEELKVAPLSNERHRTKYQHGEKNEQNPAGWTGQIADPAKLRVCRKEHESIGALGRSGIVLEVVTNACIVFIAHVVQVDKMS